MTALVEQEGSPLGRPGSTAGSMSLQNDGVRATGCSGRTSGEPGQSSTDHYHITISCHTVSTPPTTQL
jgi:hypothetical protein